MYIGLIGGIGFVVMDFYYCKFIVLVVKSWCELDFIIVYVDMLILLDNLGRNDKCL